MKNKNRLEKLQLKYHVTTTISFYSTFICTTCQTPITLTLVSLIASILTIGIETAPIFRKTIEKLTETTQITLITEKIALIYILVLTQNQLLIVLIQV